MPKYEILTPSLIDSIEALDRDSQAAWLFLDRSKEFRGCWEVDSLWPEFFFDFEQLIGHYRLITPPRLDEFLKLAEEKGYHVGFLEDPVAILDGMEKLKEPPPFSLNSRLENTVNGLLFWQVVGYNKLIADESIKAGYVVWDTGAGKTAFIAASILHHSSVGTPFDLAFVVVKGHNKIETQRKLLRLAGIESVRIDGVIDKRFDAYEEVELRLVRGEPTVVVTNYEKLRDDTDVFTTLFNKRRCLFFWDEMPTKLSNRNTQLYKSTKRALYKSFYSKPRASWMRHWCLTATPIENSPNDTYSCVNLMWPGLLGSVSDFYAMHLIPNPHSRTQYWKNLDRLEAKLAFMTHRVSREDPDVAKMFPETPPMEAPVIDWNPKHRSLYDLLTNKAVDLLGEDVNVLALIQIMQMLCDAPSMIQESAKNRERFLALLSQFGDEGELDIPFSGPKGSGVALELLKGFDPKVFTNTGHTKLERWREIIMEKHPDEKIVTHSTWASYIFPIWTHFLDKWGVSYVLYDGTPKQQQEALDRFRTDPDIRVFLSGDRGSDSIDIPQAKVGINYNIPWKWTTLQQREGRRNRVDSSFDEIYTYTLVMPDSVDERKLEICARKHQYHVAIFEGQARDEAVSLRMTPDDLRFLLTGCIPS